MELDPTRPLIPQTNQSSRSSSSSAKRSISPPIVGTREWPRRQERSQSQSQIKITHLLIPLSFFLLSFHSYFVWISTDPARKDPNNSSYINDDNVDQQWLNQIMKDIDQSLSFEDALQKEYDVCVVGAGLSGSIIAERIANGLNKKVLVIDKRDHIGGNCYDYKD